MCENVIDLYKDINEVNKEINLEAKEDVERKPEIVDPL